MRPSREREGLVARIRQIRSASAASEEKAGTAAPVRPQDALYALEARVTHLEHLVEGLQDSVHRESTRLGKRVAGLEARLQPPE